MSASLGVDLGTTTFGAAVIQDGVAEAVKDAEGRQVFPAVAHFAGRGRVTVGYDALERLVDDPANTVHSAQRLCGLRFDDPTVKIAQTAYLFELLPTDDGLPAIDAAGGPYTVPTVLGFFLRDLRLKAEAQLDSSVERATITVPAEAPEAYREGLRAAAWVAGLEVSAFVEDPIAAVTAHVAAGVEGRRFLVIDFGGATFSCALVDWNDTMAGSTTSREPFLGGSDVDLAIAVAVAQELRKSAGVDVRGQPADWRRLLLKCEAAKRELSVKPSTEVILSDALGPSGATADLRATLTRERMLGLAAPFVTQAMDLVQSLLEENDTSVKDIDAILLAGGTCHLESVPLATRAVLAKAPLARVDPSLVCALGAAIEAHRLACGEVATVRGAARALESAPSALGLATAGGGFDAVIPHGAPLPANGVRTYTTWRTGQTEMRFIILQGDSDRADENVELGQFLVDGLPARPSGEVEVELVFFAAADGTLHVAATERSSGVRREFSAPFADTLGE